MKLCLVCLRVDNELHSLDSEYVEFHDELCDFSLPTEVFYCADCEHIMKKFFKFHKQCVKALKIYLKWKATKASTRPPLSNLHTFLPPASLVHWPPSSNIANIREHSEQTDTFKATNVCIDQSNSRQSEITLKCGSVKTSVRSEKKSKRVQPITEIEEIKLEKEDDPTDDMTIRDFLQNADLFSESPLRQLDKENVKLEKYIQDDVKCDDGDENVKFDEETGTFVKVVGKNDDEALNVTENDEKYAENDGHFDDDVEEIQEVEINDEDFIKSLEGMDFDRVDSDDDYSDDGKKGKPKGRYSKQHMPFDINKLKNDLKRKLSSFEEIVAKDGTAIDREVLLQNLGERVSYHDLRSLRAACRTGSKKLLEAIQGFYEKFQEDDKFQAVFDIQYLSTYEMKLEEFEKRKTYESYINAEFKCDICYTPFKRAKDLENHIKDHHEETADNAGECCPICKVRPGKRQYKRNAHSSTHSAVYKCRLCNMVTYYRGTMRNHFAMHSGKMYNCVECDTSFKWQSAYFLHMSKYHRRKQHVCAACGRGFPSALALTAHAKKHQDDPPPELTEPMSCAECDVTFPSRAVYEAHTADVHMAPPPARRGPRGDAASLPSYQLTGINKWRKPRAQQKIRPVKCKLCNAVRLGAAWLRTHFKREHPNHDWNMLYANVKKHLCDICGNGFASVYVLRDHMNLHTGARPFPCDLCPKRFRSSVLMRDHRARHFPPTNLCTLCGKKFKSKSNLFNHMKVHTGEKSHKCEICGKGFQYSTTLNEHVRGVHHNIRRVRKRTHGEKERVEEMVIDHETISL